MARHHMRRVRAALATGTMLLRSNTSRATTDTGCGTIVVSAALALGAPSAIASLHPLLTSNSFADENETGLLYLPLLSRGCYAPNRRLRAG